MAICRAILLITPPASPVAINLRISAGRDGDWAKRGGAAAHSRSPDAVRRDGYVHIEFFTVTGLGSAGVRLVRHVALRRRTEPDLCRQVAAHRCSKLTFRFCQYLDKFFF